MGGGVFCFVFRIFVYLYTCHLCIFRQIYTCNNYSETVSRTINKSKGVLSESKAVIIL